jgi:hypothetical protein
MSPGVKWSTPERCASFAGMLKIDKEKYYSIHAKEGLAAAITALHHDMWQAELSTFEGEKGFQPKEWDRLEEMRKFSIELWDRGLQ